MGGHFPDEKQTLLLKSALSERLDAIRHFVSWLELSKLDSLNPTSKTFLTDFMDSIDKGSQRMLPLVIHNLGEGTHPYFKFLIGTRKNYWVQNKQIAHKALQVLRILNKNNIPGMQIKGLDLAANFYENIGHRPMNNGNILIPYEFKEKVFELVEKGDFENTAVRYGSEAKGIRYTIHLGFEGTIRIDLHWSIFAEYAYSPEASDFIWQDATKETISGDTYYKMSATHALFVSLVNGRSFEYVPPFRWVADAKMIVDKSSIDWDEILELAKRFYYKPFLKRAIAYLIEHHQFQIPSDFVEKINNFEVSQLEEEYYHTISVNSRKYGFVSSLWFSINKRVVQYHLFLKNTDISLSGYLFSWVFNRLRARVAK